MTTDEMIAKLEAENAELKKQLASAAEDPPMAEVVAKAESIYMKAAESKLAVRRIEFDTYVQKHAQARGLSATDAGVALYKSGDAEYSRLAGELTEARRELEFMPNTIVEQMYRPRVEALQKQLATLANQYALDHRISENEAHVTLAQLSEAYKKTHETLSTTIREMGATAQKMLEKRSRNVQADIYKSQHDARMAAVMAEPVELKKYRIGLATFAKTIGKTEVQAAEAFLRTEEGAELYADYRKSQIGRG